MSSNRCHANGVSQKPFDGLIRQVAQAADAFQDSHNEADRLAALQAAQRLVEVFQKPQDAVYNLAYSPTQVMCVRIAMDLGIFSTLCERNGPITLEDLAATKGADLVLTERVLRILAGIGYVAEHDVRVYIPTKMTRQMTDRLSGAVVRFIFDIGMPTLAKVPEFLRMTNFRNPSGALNGALQYAEKTEMSLWDWVPTKPGFLDVCNTFMEADRGSRPSWLEWFPVKERIIDGFKEGESNVLLVDVAGGRGHDLVAFQSKFSGVQGRLILEDLPHVVAEATQHPKIEHVSFDLFQTQPIQGARTYYMKFILHDWSDEESRLILSHLGAAMKKGYSKLIIEEFVLADKECAMLPAMWDWEMLIFCNSMERTASQWTKVLDSAGFRIVKIWAPPGDGQSIIEAELKEPDEDMKSARSSHI
ncbi:O-methyltransferase [Aspergillus vadensis CBS 113365]|uniref:O-methyltransferase n=1 Tax=Aspergillus vadensis (strain CBS 113365 / IMI 142717 / IBT 24658) TaxID=1448311 RepID=A0A319BPG9_ASPVC|nr:O-methyltransferase [Aspergillus vadensis CBS 113365]PYH73050.1 O-methyltransferase [Aspergillus vadensis CBS 113365]